MTGQFYNLRTCTPILKDTSHVIDFIFLFYLYCVHDKLLEDGLNLMKINSGYGGSQQQMHQKNINKEFGYLDVYVIILDVGDEQHMVFQEGGDGKLWMTP